MIKSLCCVRRFWKRDIYKHIKFKFNHINKWELYNFYNGITSYAVQQADYQSANIIRLGRNGYNDFTLDACGNFRINCLSTSTSTPYKLDINVNSRVNEFLSSTQNTGSSTYLNAANFVQSGLAKKFLP